MRRLVLGTAKILLGIPRRGALDYLVAFKQDNCCFCTEETDGEDCSCYVKEGSRIARPAKRRDRERGGRHGGIASLAIGSERSSPLRLERDPANGRAGGLHRVDEQKSRRGFGSCGIDHVPPPLLQQLKPGGIMVIPVGPPHAQHVLKISKQQAAEGTMNVVRSDIYNGHPESFVPFTKLDGDVIKGTHSGS
jgi:Protein-L-isoaspartate(D-aspartate) O-methyltransferase (PCMT)